MPVIPCDQVDAFTREPFRGNPAAVCPLPAWLPDATMQAIAAENNLSETAFFVRRPDGDFDLRWFTPAVEVDLCGHATLASAFLLMTHLEPGRDQVVFHTRSGPLPVARQGDRLVMDFPLRPAREHAFDEAAARALGLRPRLFVRARDTIAVYDRAEEVRALRPDMAALAALPDTFAVVATAPGTGRDEDVDFVSRFFAPAKGVPEDPVTGSAHCSLAPLWGGRLGKKALRARQVGPRSGEIDCEIVADRVRLAGHAVLVKTGTLVLP
jgi:PhzF family phenazine biosynthesis protein